MRRREFVTLIGGMATAWPLAARAQQPAMPMIGYLGSFGSSNSYLLAFGKGLRETGYVEGQNVSIEYRSTEGRNDPMAALPLVKDLVERRVSVIVASSMEGPGPGPPPFCADKIGAAPLIVGVAGTPPKKDVVVPCVAEG
jgi:putative ABC transport system substrate-binding protein